MLSSTFTNMRIVGLAAAVPSKEITAEEMYARYGQEIVDKTIKMVGVQRSRQSVKQQVSSDLGCVAAREIMARKQIPPESIGVLLYVTQTPDYKVPATAMLLHKRLGLSMDCAAMDINLGCSGFVYGLQMLCAMLQSTNAQRGLLVVGDVSSKMSTRDNRASSLLFGDGSAAVLVEKDDHTAPLSFAMRTDGNRYPAIIIPGGAFRAMTYLPEELAEGNRAYPYPLMDGVGVFNFSIREVPALIQEFMAEQGTAMENYDALALHQANLYIMKQIAKKLKASPEQLLVSVDRFGNTSSASIPLTLVDRYGKAEAGTLRILMSGFGVGLSWAVADVTIDAAGILPILISDECYDPKELDQQEYNA